MKWLVTITLILLAAVLLGLFAFADPGYVLFARGQQSIQMSLSLFVILLVIGFAALYLGLRLLIGLWGMPGSLRRWRQRQRRERAWRDTNRGLIEFAQGHWEKAERYLMRHAFDSQTPLLNYLAAARAAQKQNRSDKRDEYLNLARQNLTGAGIAVDLTQAELQLTQAQLPQALALLKNLQLLEPKHAHVLYLLARVYELQRNWQELKAMLPLLRKRDALKAEPLRQLERHVMRELMTLATQRGKIDDLQTEWKSLSRNLQHDTEMIRHYARCLLTLEQHEQAETLLRDALRRGFDTDLVYIYGLITIKDKDKQLAAAETWLHAHESDPILLLTLGRLCIHNQLWGKARSYLEASLGVKPRSDTYRELGHLMEKINQPKAAAEHFRKGLLLAHEEKIDDLLTVIPHPQPILPQLV